MRASPVYLGLSPGNEVRIWPVCLRNLPKRAVILAQTFSVFDPSATLRHKSPGQFVRKESIAQRGIGGWSPLLCAPSSIRRLVAFIPARAKRRVISVRVNDSFASRRGSGNWFLDRTRWIRSRRQFFGYVGDAVFDSRREFPAGEKFRWGEIQKRGP